jgi:ketosteroid isomerase-like protein
MDVHAGKPLSASVVPEWVQSVFEAVDAGDARRFAAVFTEDGQFIFGNAPAVVGRPAVEQAVAGFFASIRDCRHHLARFWPGAGHCAMDGTVTYQRHDGRELTLPFANVFVLRGAQVAEYRVYVDLAPLFAA